MAHFRPFARIFRPSRSWLVAGALALGCTAGPAQARDLFSSLSSLGPGVDSGQVRLAGKAENSPDHHHPKPQPIPGDLTTLTLEELMELEVVPINVLGGHTHPAGQWMVGYRYMFTHQGGNLVGSNEVSTRRLLRRYLLAPESMDMEMHMLEGMYAPTDRLTLMLMAPYSRMWMEKQSLFSAGNGHGHGAAPLEPRAAAVSPNAPRRVESRSAGWGDLTLMSLYTFSGSSESGRRLLFNGGLSLTGTIQKTHVGGGRHEYMMQLGSGTVDLLPGITYLGESSTWSWGAQAMGTLRLGTNEVGYHLGNRLRLNAWGSYRLTDWFAPSLRLEGQVWGDIHGQDPSLDPEVDPTYDSGNYGGRRVDLLLGANLFAPKGKWKGTRLSVEGGIPVYQNLNGPQLEMDWTIGFSLSYAR